MTACAAARSSYEYWYRAASDPNNAWFDIIVENCPSIYRWPIPNFWCRVKVAIQGTGADIWGAVKTGDVAPVYNFEKGEWTVGFKWNIGKAFKSATTASTSVWRLM